MTLADIVSRQNLTASSRVIDVGGYKGFYADEVIKQFNCGVIIFEPIFYRELVEEYKNDPHVHIHPFALGRAQGVREMYVRGEGSSFWKEWAKSEEKKQVLTLKASEALRNGGDVLKLNCEGAEYEIIEDLYHAWGLIMFNEILVQFHPIPGADRKRAEEMLGKTHEQVFNEKWSLWRKKHG